MGIPAKGFANADVLTKFLADPLGERETLHTLDALGVKQQRILDHASTTLDTHRALPSGRDMWGIIVAAVDLDDSRYSEAQIERVKRELVTKLPSKKGIAILILMSLLYYSASSLPATTSAALRVTLKDIARDALVLRLRGADIDQAIGKAVINRKKALLGLLVVTSAQALAHAL
jgi:hypothetical protein